MIALTAGNTYLRSLRQNIGKLEKITLAVTIGMTLDSFVSPLLFDGITLHEKIGFKPDDYYINGLIVDCERALTGICNIYLGIKDRLEHYKERKE